MIGKTLGRDDERYFHPPNYQNALKTEHMRDLIEDPVDLQADSVEIIGTGNKFRKTSYPQKPAI